MLLAELYKETLPEKALENLHQALKYSRTSKEKTVIQTTIEEIQHDFTKFTF